jgi:plastocyanin
VKSARRPFAFAVALTLCVLALAAPPARAASPAPASVSMKRFEFLPERLIVNRGRVVQWTYDEDPMDPQPNCESPYLQLPGSPVRCPGHNATSIARFRGKPVFASGTHRADGFPFRASFAVPGVFPYVCTLHGGETSNNPLTSMEATLIVVPEARGIVTDRDDVRGQLDLRSLAASRNGAGDLVVTAFTWQGWATNALRAGTPYRLSVVFDVNTDGAIDGEDVTARLVYEGGHLQAKLSGVDGASSVHVARVGATGVRFTLPASSSAANAGADHQLAAASRSGSASDRVPELPGWLPLLAS